ncbi:MAG: arylesterase [Gammaproteobacteria bacterium]|nr:arylesterase [Gammaproteobacteria bacterium]
MVSVPSGLLTCLHNPCASRTISLVTKRSFVAALLMFALPILGSATPTPTAPKILVLGDSISAGYGLAANEGWVSLLQNRLKSQGYGYRVVNASVTGETTTGGLARLPRALSLHRPVIVVIELGGNDGLRGLPLETSRANLQKMINLSREAGAAVLLLGMKIPPNYGPRYASEFERLYADLARRNNLAFEPFFLDRVALADGMMQDDGIHPTAKAQPIMLETLWPPLTRLLRR